MALGHGPRSLVSGREVSEPAVGCYTAAVPSHHGFAQARRGSPLDGPDAVRRWSRWPGMLGVMRPLPDPYDDIAAGRPAPIGLAGPALLGSRLLTKDLAFPDRRARGVPACAACCPTGS